MQNILYRTKQLSYSNMIVLWTAGIDHSNTADSPNVSAFLMQVITFRRRDEVRVPLSPGQFP